MLHTVNFQMPPGLTAAEQEIYQQHAQDFLEALPPSSTPPDIFLRKAIHNAAAHALNTHRTQELFRQISSLPDDKREKQHPLQVRLLAQAAKNSEISTKLCGEIEKSWPAPPPPRKEQDPAEHNRYAPYMDRFQDLMDQIDLEETARELGCEVHEIPGLPTIVPYPAAPVQEPAPEPDMTDFPLDPPVPDPPQPPPKPQTPKRLYTGSPYVF